MILTGILTTFTQLAICMPPVESYISQKQHNIQMSKQTRMHNIVFNPHATTFKLEEALQYYAEAGNKFYLKALINHPNIHTVRRYPLLRAIENIAYYEYFNLIIKMLTTLPQTQTHTYEFLGKALEGAAGSGNIEIVYWILTHPEAGYILQKNIDRSISAAKYYKHYNIVQLLY